jgi:hypothetical protein
LGDAVSRVLFEIWPAKGSAPLIAFESEADAIAYAAERSIVVPGLAVVKATTETQRVELWRHTEKVAA